MDFSIEKMTQQDVRGIYEIEKECFSVAWSENSIREELENELAFFYVCKIQGKVIGYGGMHYVSKEGYIDNIAVTSSYRKQGIGKMILQKLEDKVISTQGELLTLEVRQSNADAISLYENFGFITEGIRKNYYSDPKENALIMTKRYL